MPDQDLEALQLEVLRKRVEAKRAQEDSAPRPNPNSGEFGEISPLQSAISGTAEGLTAGYSGEISGRVRAAVTAPFVDETYGQLRDKYVGEQNRYASAAAKANPLTSLGFELGSTVISPASKVLGPVEGAGIVANMGRAALQGGLIAGGKSETSPLESPQKLKDFALETGAGAATGLVTQGALSGVGAIAKRFAPEWLTQFARERAVKAATGQNKRAIKQMSKLGQINQIGDDLLNGSEEIGVKAPLRFGSSVESIKNRAAENKDKAWGAVEGAYSSIDKKTGGQSVDLMDVSQRLMEKAKAIEPVPKNLPVIEKLRAEATWLAQQEGRIPLKRAQDLKNQYVFKMADPHTHALGLDGNNIVRNAYAEGIENSIKKHASAADAKKWKLGMRNYGSNASAAGAADDRAVANISNRFISPSDYAVGIGSALAGAAKGGDNIQNSLFGLATSLGHKLLRERGSSMAAVTAKNMSNAIKNNPGTLGAVQRGVSQLPEKPSTALLMQWLNRRSGTEE